MVDTESLHYCENLYRYTRRQTREAMLTSDTRDTEACVNEALGLAEAGCEIVRVTAQTRKYAENLEHIKRGLLDRGCDVPLVADIHFKPDAALEAAKWVEKVRVNPGNYADSKKFAIREYTDSEYEEELERIRERFVPLVKLCQERGVAMRIGTNHGSLSDRIMNRYGDTPLGMVESAFEFACIAREEGYHQFVFSMKASNPKVMIGAYRLLVARLNQLGDDWNYPIHLGVTEAGDGEDGRIKSAIGIGSLLLDGVGDTIRVSLTEDAVCEIPVARALISVCDRIASTGGGGDLVNVPSQKYDLFDYVRRPSEEMRIGGYKLGSGETFRVFTSQRKWDQLAHKMDQLGDFKPEIVVDSADVVAIDPRDGQALADLNASEAPRLVTVVDGVDLPAVAAFRLLAARLERAHPILLKDTLQPRQEADGDFQEGLLETSAVLGSLLADGIGDAILVQGEEAPGQSMRLSFNVLQAAGARIFKTDYVACPSCGRTLFNLQETTAKIRAATGHLKGVRIAIMGCIVNGPGEMADADFGYVGGAPAKINLYVGKQAVKFNIPQEDAVAQLIHLIKEHGRWVEPREELAASMVTSAP